MHHSKVENWSPDVLAQSGLFDGMHEWPTALLDAPVVILQPREPLARSRSGAALAIFVIAGEVQRQVGDTTHVHCPGSFVGVRELAADGNAVEVAATSESAVMLLDRHRIYALCQESQSFAVQVVAALLQLDTGPAVADHGKMTNLPIDAVDPAGLGSMVLVKLINRDAIELCHGAEVGRNAIRAIGRAVELSTRPDDVRTFLGGNEFLIAVKGDRLAASIIANRLIARCSRIVAIPDMRTPLPHLHMVIGLGEVKTGDTLATVASRVSAAASSAAKCGIIFSA